MICIDKSILEQEGNMIIDYLDIYNRLWELGDFLSYKDSKKRSKLHQWALNEDRRKAQYGIADITMVEF